MKNLGCDTKQNFLRNSFKITAVLMLASSQLCQSVSAQTDPSAIKIRNTASYTYSYVNVIPDPKYPTKFINVPDPNDPTKFVQIPDPNDPNKGRTIEEVISFSATSSQLDVGLIDPFGRVTSCNGGLLADYLGFSAGLYELLNATGDIGLPIPLTGTVPRSQVSGNKIAGLSPNFFNANPFFLTNSDEGKYSFLLDPSRGQLDVGREFILAVKPPANSPLGGRRIRIRINSRVGGVVNYTATSLDGNPISADNGATSVDGKIDITDVATIGLSLAVFNFNVSVCEAQSIQLLKTGDRAAAEPGDIVIYRLGVRNLANATISQPEIRDDLPLGFQYIEGSVKAELGGTVVPVTIQQSGRNLIFRPNVLLPFASDTRIFNIVYAAQVTNDAIRGTGINRATLSGIRSDNNQTVRDGPVSHQLRIRPGILSDCGSLIGRVFVDKNFDGEQQPGEPGVPNAVIYMDDGTRIVTDVNGLYSLSGVLSGSRTLAIDLTSVPGYTLAPNLYFIERNSQSRLVKIAPGGLHRVNFAVTPVARGISNNKQTSAK